MRGSVSTAARSETSTWLAPLTRTRYGSGTVVSVGDEDEALDDLTYLGADCLRRVRSGVCGLVERDDLERDAFPKGGVEHALTGAGDLGHGPSLAQAIASATLESEAVRSMTHRASSPRRALFAYSD